MPLLNPGLNILLEYLDIIVCPKEFDPQIYDNTDISETASYFKINESSK